MEPQALARLTCEPIDAQALSRAVADPSCGAIATFLGIVRAEQREDGVALEALEYTAYEPMALREMQRLADETAARHAIQAIRVQHRLGVLRIGDASVAVVVSSPHRAAAFDACRELIERLKADVPIFKREIWADESRTWVHDLSGAPR